MFQERGEQVLTYSFIYLIIVVAVVVIGGGVSWPENTCHGVVLAFHHGFWG